MSTTKIANLEATIGRIGGGFDDAMQALSQRMLVLENQLAATNDAVEAVSLKAEKYDDALFEEVRQQLSSAIGEAMLAEVDADGLLALSALRDLGVGLCVDGFGSGMTSLTLLRRLPRFLHLAQ